MTPTNGPAAFQLTQLLSEMNRTTQVFGERSKSFETIANSLDSLNKMFQSSQIFKKANVRFMSQFYKKAPTIYKKLTSSIDTLTQTMLNAPPIAGGGSDTPTPNGTQFMGDLLEQLNRLGGSITGLGSDINNIETTADLNDESQGRITGLHSDLNSLQEEMMEVMRAVASTNTGAEGAADQIDDLTGNLSDMVRQFSILTQEGQINSDTYFEMVRRLNDINSRLDRSQSVISQVNNDLKETVESEDEITDNLGKGINSMLALQALDLFRGANVGDVENQISSLHDELIDLRKTMGDASLPIDEWRRSAIDTAKAFNKMNIAADPAEIAHIYSVIGKAGVRTAEDVKSLAKSIKLVTEATDISAEEAAEFSYTLSSSWGLGTKYIDKYNSMLVKMQSLHNVSASKIMNQTKEMGDSFMTVLRDLDQKGKEVFMVNMANSLGALESAFIDDKDLVKDLGLALTDPAQAAEKFADMLQGTGYSVQQMASDLKKGDVTKALEQIFKGSERFADMSAEQLRIVSERSGKSVSDLIKMGTQSGAVITNLSKLQKAGIDEIADPKSLIKLAQEENKKLGSLFERLGKKIKTWVSDVGIGAVEGLGVELLDLAPTIAPLVIILDKLGFSISGIGDGTKKAVKGIFSLGMSMISFLATSISSVGVLGTFGVLLDAATAQVVGFGIALNAALGPVGWIILGVVALTAAVVALIKWGPVLWDWFGKKFPNAAEAIEKAFSPIGKMFSKLWDLVKPIVSMMSKMIGSVLVGAFKILWSIAKVAFKGIIFVFNLLGAVVKPVIELIGDAIGWLWEKFSGSDNVTEAQDGLSNWVSGAKLMIDGIKNIADSVVGFFDDIGGTFDNINNDFDLFLAWIDNGFASLGETISNWASKIGGVIMAPFNFIKDAIMYVIDKVESLLSLAGGAKGIVKGIARFFGFGKEKEPVAKNLPTLNNGLPNVVPKRSPRMQMKYDLRRQQDIQDEIRESRLLQLKPSNTIKESIISNFDTDRTKVMEPEPSKKIFAENPEIVIKGGNDLDVHQEDVVAAIRDLTSIMKKGQRKEDQDMRRPNAKVRPIDEQAELAREWAL